MKSNVVSIGCYIWLLPTTGRLPENRDCLLKLYMLNQLEQFFVNFSWKMCTLYLLRVVS